MRKHPFKAEEDKTEPERGHYLEPEVFGQPEERGIEWARHPAIMREIKGTSAGRVEEMKQNKPK